MANDNDRIPLTQAGLRELKEEHQRLVEKKRPGVVERIVRARDIGDMGQDNELAQAKQELAFIDGRINELEEVINRATVVNGDHLKCKTVAFGCKVTVEVRKKKQIFHLVGEWEADPASLKISHQSPLGQALLGKKVGDKVEVEAPVGKLIYTVVKIN